MGYYVQIFESDFRLDASKLDEAYKRMCALNDNDGAKTGGSSGGGGVSMKDPRPAGMSYHPARWFAWMDADYPSKCENVNAILTMLGFEVGYDKTGSISHLLYDSKIGAEHMFFAAIADLVDDGSYICWRGEDDGEWRWLFTNGEMVTQTQQTRVWS